MLSDWYASKGRRGVWLHARVVLLGGEGAEVRETVSEFGIGRNPLLPQFTTVVTTRSWPGLVKKYL